MKKNLKVYISAVLAIILVAGMIIFPPQSLACGSDGLTSEDGDVTNCAETLTIEESEEAEDDEEVEEAEDTEDAEYFYSDDTLYSEKTSTHSLFLAGSDVTSKDDVFGIGFLAGNLVNAAGYYKYGFFAGNSVEVTGEIAEDLFVAGNTIKISDSASIYRDLYAAGNLITINTNLYGNVFTAGNRLVLDSVTIDGDLETAASEIVIKGKTSISGTFKYNEDATIAGLDNLSFGKKETYASTSVKTTFLSKLVNKMISILGTLILAFVALALFKKFGLKLLKDFEAKHIFKNVLVGLGILIFVPIATVLIMITVIGAKISIVALASWFLLLIFSAPVSGLIFGDILARKIFNKEKMSPYLKVTLGIFLLGVLSLIPFVGGLIDLASLLFGIGYLFSNLLPKKA